MPSESAAANSSVAAQQISALSSDHYVKLNVGGSLFQTTLGTLTKYDSMLKAMFSGRMEVLRDKDGYVLIDRCGKHFGLILNFLREGAVPLPECRTEINEILVEARYYLLQELVDLCYSGLLALQRDQIVSSSGVCRVPIVVSKKQVEQIVQSCSGRPVIELLLNRQNNKYSYNASSDENFLRNQELFDKLILRFNNRVLFIKNIGIGSSEICQWTFYGNANRKVEVCCTSIVYATDKKQTKVEFPEARIYEEALNVLLTFDQDYSGICVRCKGAAENNSGNDGRQQQQQPAKWADLMEHIQQNNPNLRLLVPESATVTGNGRIDWRLEQLALGAMMNWGEEGGSGQQKRSHESGAGTAAAEQQQQLPSSSASGAGGAQQSCRGSHQPKLSECDD